MALLTLVMGSLPTKPLTIPHHSSSFYSRLPFFRTQVALSSTATLPLPPLQPLYPLVYCGRGDKKTAKGKRFRHSYGNSRPRNKSKGRGPPRPFTPAAPKRDFDDWVDDDEGAVEEEVPADEPGFSS